MAACVSGCGVCTGCCTACDCRRSPELPPLKKFQHHLLSQSFSTSSLPCLTVSYQLHRNSVIDSMVFHSGFMCWTIWFLWMRHGSTWVDTLTVETFKNGVLQTNVHCMKIVCIHKDRCFVCSVSIMNWGTIVFWRDNYCRKFSKSLHSICLSARREWTGSLVSAMCGRAHTVKRTRAFLLDFFNDCIVRCGLWPPWSPDLPPPEFLLCGFLKERIYSNNRRSMVDLQHNNKQIVTGTDHQTLRKVAKTTS